ncbi:EAL domain-containing protein [Alteromonas sp. PRIM-21]|uniref:EAL domain-containing protein n=1 Tax=Alteromonas sp. PRIM-21 TaxID=1454978 RepID=UPI0022B94700|nr:EAL domain-containing protein [Alteromonas sp. PRIM-21]MCZ8530027.1 EAL domain-containing protein [Alteromonas sp. PRIM-21]
MTDITRPLILVVEDNLVEAMNVKNALIQAGMQVLGIAKTESELYALVDKCVPDLILMDIDLGGSDSGIGIAKSITERFKVPIVFSTSYCDDTTISNALSISPYGYLVKPYGVLSLTTTIQVALERKKTEKALASSNRRFAMASEIAKLGVLEVDTSTQSVVIESVENLFDFPRKMPLSKFLSLFPEEKEVELKEAIHLKSNYLTTLQLKIEGQPTKWFQVVLSDIGWGEDYVQIGAIQDISILQSTQSNLSVADKIVSEIKEGVLVCDAEGLIIKANQSLCEMLGTQAEHLISTHINNVFPKARKHDPRPDYLEDGLRTELTIVSEGRRFHLTMSVTSFNLDDGETNFVAILTDVSELKSSESQLKYLAFTDALTGAGNRNFLNSIVETYSESCEPCSIIFIDIDEFKLINDTHGHEVGDEILRACASRFKASLRDDDTVIRFGGDEFVIVTSTTCQKLLNKMTSRLSSSLKSVFKTTSGDFQVTASIGLASSTENMSPTELLKNADIAMFSAKQGGKNSVVTFSEDLSKNIEYRLFIQQGLKSAIQNKQITAYFQPIIDSNGEVLAVEALARWHIPSHGPISPEKFIPIAERTKHIHDIGLLMLDEVCFALKALSGWGFSDVKFNLNMSPVQLQNTGVIELFAERFAFHNIDPRRIVIEITESTLQSSKAREVLTKIKALGVIISIDDFGTGFSCISELADETYDAIKIDRSLLPDFPLQSKQQKRRALIIENVVSMCVKLGMPCTLEGLETVQQVAFAKKIGAKAMQGYYFTKPLSLVGLMEYLQAEHASPLVSVTAPTEGQ